MRSLELGENVAETMEVLELGEAMSEVVHSPQQRRLGSTGLRAGSPGVGRPNLSSNIQDRFTHSYPIYISLCLGVDPSR